MPANIRHFREILQRHLPALREEFHVQTLGLFGSYVRGENRTGSDLDVLVTFAEVPSLFRFVELEERLKQLLGVKVDLVMEEALKPRIRSRVLQELVPV